MSKGLLFTGKSKEKYEQDKRSGHDKDCYFCKRHNGETVVAIKDGCNAVSAPLEVTETVFNTSHAGEITAYICEECGLLIGAFAWSVLKKYMAMIDAN